MLQTASSCVTVTLILTGINLYSMEIEEIIKEGLERHFIYVAVEKVTIGYFAITVRKYQEDWETRCHIPDDFQDLAYDYLDYLAEHINEYIHSRFSPWQPYEGTVNIREIEAP